MDLPWNENERTRATRLEEQPFYRAVPKTASSIPQWQREPTSYETAQSALGKRDPSQRIDISSRAPSDEPASWSERKKPRKRANYLKHAQRCSIIVRIDRGEPQAALAREFGVTRAAVCQMYKNRDEILAREDTENYVESPPPKEITKAKTVALLLATLRCSRSTHTAYRRAAARLAFILVEEVLSSYDAPAVKAAGTSGQGCNSHCPPLCGITMGGESEQLLRAFHLIDLDAPTGRIDVKLHQNDGYESWRLLYLDVPANITDFKVILFSSFGNGSAECRSIEVLLNIGVQELNISVVMAVCSSRGYEEISIQFPGVTIHTATIADDWTINASHS